MRFSLILLAAAAASATEDLKRICYRSHVHEIVKNGGFEFGPVNKSTPYDILHWNVEQGVYPYSIGRNRVTGGFGFKFPPDLYPRQGDYAIHMDPYPTASISQSICLQPVPNSYVIGFVYGYSFYPADATVIKTAPIFRAQLGNRTIYESNVCGNKSATLTSTELCDESANYTATIVKLRDIAVVDGGHYTLNLTWTNAQSGPAAFSGFLDDVRAVWSQA